MDVVYIKKSEICRERNATWTFDMKAFIQCNCHMNSVSSHCRGSGWNELPGAQYHSESCIKT